MSKSHTYHVLNFVLENQDKAKDKIALILASIFHDIGNKSCRLRKIVKSEIDQCYDDHRKEELKSLAYAFRMEHMYWGTLRTIEILKEIGFKPDVILKVVELISKHDLRKCGVGYEIKDNDEQLLNECDAMWMHTKDGLERDIQRAIDQGNKPLSLEEQQLHNLKENKGLFKFLNKVEYTEGEA